MSIVNGLVCDGLSRAVTRELAKMVAVSPRGGYYSVTDAKGKKNAVLSWGTNKAVTRGLPLERKAACLAVPLPPAFLARWAQVCGLVDPDRKKQRQERLE